MRIRTFLLVATGTALICTRGNAQSFPLDTAHYHGGPILSPNITCLLWTPASNKYSSTDLQTIQDYLIGLQRYFTNAAAPAGTTGAGTEPVDRQYGVWGATFSGTCAQDTTAPYNNEVVDLNDHSPTGAIPHEINTALGSGVYTPNTVVVVFTKGWAHAGGQQFAQHWSMAANQYAAAVNTDLQDYGIIGHELIEGAADPILGTGWVTDQNQTTVAPCVQANGGSWGSEVCDDGYVTSGVLLQAPLSDGFGSSSNPFPISDAIDDIDGANTTTACSTYTCSAVGNVNQCSTGNPGTPVVYSGNAFTNMTTTFPATVVQTGTKINVLTRTPTGIAHLVSANDGVSFSAVSPAPIGVVTENLTAYSKDGTTIDMYGRGTDGALYHWVYNGSSWATPVWLGGYLMGPPAAGFVQINGWQGDTVWVTQNDHQIYIWINGGWYYANMPTNVLAMSPPQVFPRNNTIDIYFTGEDGHMYVDAGWTGGWQQLPGSGFGPMTAASRPSNSTRFDVFVKQPMDQGGSSTSWIEFQSGVAVNNGVLSSLPIGGGPTAALNYANSSAIWLLFTKANQVVLATSDSTGTSYANWGIVQAPNITSPLTAYTPDANTVLAYARQQSNGHLIQLRWVGGILQPVQDLGVAIM